VALPGPARPRFTLRAVSAPVRIPQSDAQSCALHTALAAASPASHPTGVAYSPSCSLLLLGMQLVADCGKACVCKSAAAATAEESSSSAQHLVATA
jgi:hypothetical protein